jgi:hypothetical protein
MTDPVRHKARRFDLVVEIIQSQSPLSRERGHAEPIPVWPISDDGIKNMLRLHNDPRSSMIKNIVTDIET